MTKVERKPTRGEIRSALGCLDRWQFALPGFSPRQYEEARQFVAAGTRLDDALKSVGWRFVGGA